MRQPPRSSCDTPDEPAIPCLAVSFSDAPQPSGAPDSAQHLSCQGNLHLGFLPHLRDASQEIGLLRRLVR
jgi:hypothetical protein